MRIDNRLIGDTSENIFLSLLNQKRVFAQSFDTQSFDGVVFDLKNRFFKLGVPRFFVQIKCRGSASDEYNPQGHSPENFKAIHKTAKQLLIHKQCLYFVVGFFKNQDIRQTVYYVIPFSSLRHFLGKGQYRFSVSKCERMLKVDSAIAKI